MTNEKQSNSFFRKPKSWLFLPLVAYLFAVPFLGPGALFVPIVILNAPLGIIGCFEKISPNPEPHQEGFIFICHVMFWLLLITGIVASKKMPLRWLKTIWFILVLALIMSISGCAIQLGPSLRSSGNWH